MPYRRLSISTNLRRRAESLCIHPQPGAMHGSVLDFPTRIQSLDHSFKVRRRLRPDSPSEVKIRICSGASSSLRKGCLPSSRLFHDERLAGPKLHFPKGARHINTDFSFSCARHGSGDTWLT